MELSKLTLEIFSKLEQQWLMDCQRHEPNPWSPPSKPKRKTRILSIDGGCGIRDLLVAAEALIHLESLIQSHTGNSAARIPDFFDLIAATGVAGILAALLTAADSSSARPLFSARDAAEFVRSRRSRVYRPAGRGLLFSKSRQRRFSEKSFEGVLREAFGNLTLKNTCRPLLVPCYDLNSSAPFVFSRADATESPSFDFELWKVCRATSATPGFFKPFRLASVDGKTSCAAVDGGLVMNNPSAAAVTHVLHNKRDFPSVDGVEDLLVLSLGNGHLAGGVGSRLSGSAGCSTPEVMEIVLRGVSETVDQILGNAFCWNRSDYVRIQANGMVTNDETELTAEGMRKAGTRMLGERGVESLPFGGKRLLTETNGERMEGFVKRLLASEVAIPASPSKETAVATEGS